MRNKRLWTTGERGVIQPQWPREKPYMEEVLLKMSREKRVIAYNVDRFGQSSTV